MAKDTVAEIKEKLLDAEFRKLSWLDDEMVMWQECSPNVMLTNSYDFEDDTVLWLNLVFRWPSSETDDDRI